MSVRRALSTLLAAGTLVAGAWVALSASGPSGAATPRCRPSQMAISTGVSQGAAGTFYIPIVFTNEGAACALWGLPAVQPVTAAHAPLGPAATNDSVGQAPVHHVVGHGQSVASAFGVADTANYPTSLCHARTAWGIEVRLDGFAGPRYVRLKISVCTSRASTHVQLVVPGRTGVPTS